MSNFNTFFEKETQSTIEGLLGVAPTVTFKSDELINDFSTIMPPMAQATIQVNGGLEGKLLLLLPPLLRIAGSQWRCFLLNKYTRASLCRKWDWWELPPVWWL